VCGIAGIFDPTGNSVFAMELLRSMNSRQFERGPDDEGYFIGNGIALAHRRLSIIDLQGGHQPIFNENKTVCVVFNGEIYNYEGLIRELERLGHTFSTRSDTEVIVHAWEEWGERCVERFRGMFAFGLYDQRRRQLFLARDRLGVKPLLYTVFKDGTFAFASDMKVLRAHPDFDDEVDYDSIDDFLSLGYVLDPGTIFRRVKKVPAGHTLCFHQDGTPCSLVSPTQYWDVSSPSSGEWGRRSESDVRSRLVELIDESVALRMVADVPVGAFLSGGVDSSAVVASMSRIRAHSLSTFSIGFTAREYDETQYAQLVAKKFNTSHYERQLSPECFQSLDSLPNVFGEPFADMSAIPTLSLSQFASESLKVVLSGDGADEIFGGYRRHQMHLFENSLRSYARKIGMSKAISSIARWYPKADWAPRPLRAKTTLEAIGLDPCDAYHLGVSVIKPSIRSVLYTDKLRGQIDGQHSRNVFRQHYSKRSGDDSLQAIQYVDIKTYLVGDINTKVDRSTMAYSLEAREPLMDHELVDFAMSLPTKFKIEDGVGKHLFKKSLEDRLPLEILYRKKMGFVLPIANWFRGPLAKQVEALATDSFVSNSGWFSVDAVRRFVREHHEGVANHERVIASLLVLDTFFSGTH
jgi:asparagine synthase (glutamine-hydrolysing)